MIQEPQWKVGEKNFYGNVGSANGRTGHKNTNLTGNARSVREASPDCLWKEFLVGKQGKNTEGVSTPTIGRRRGIRQEVKKRGRNSKRMQCWARVIRSGTFAHRSSPKKTNGLREKNT